MLVSSRSTDEDKMIQISVRARLPARPTAGNDGATLRRTHWRSDAHRVAVGSDFADLDDLNLHPDELFLSPLDEGGREGEDEDLRASRSTGPGPNLGSDPSICPSAAARSIWATGLGAVPVPVPPPFRRYVTLRRGLMVVVGRPPPPIPPPPRRPSSSPIPMSMSILPLPPLPPTPRPGWPPSIHTPPPPRRTRAHAGDVARTPATISAMAQQSRAANSSADRSDWSVGLTPAIALTTPRNPGTTTRSPSLSSSSSSLSSSSTRWWWWWWWW